MTKLCNQTLLQSTFAEALCLYVSAYVTRRPEFAEAQILDYRIPKDKLIVISTALAHMDKRNWNLGFMEEHPVESFWAERFLNYNSPSARQTPSALSSTVTTSSIAPSPDGAISDPPEPKFSLNGYANTWIPFGGGIHECHRTTLGEAADAADLCSDQLYIRHRALGPTRDCEAGYREVRIWSVTAGGEGWVSD